MRHAFVRYGIVAFIGVLVFASFAQAATKTFVLKDGTRITGEVISESDETIVVKTRLGRVTVARYSIEEVIEVVLPAEEYATKKAALADDDLDGHLELGRWAMSKGLYDQAMERCEFVLAADAENSSAAILKRQVEAIQNAEAQRNDEAENPTPTTRPTTVADGGGIDPDALITMEDIYRIRLAESRSTYNDNRAIRRMRVTFKNDLLDRLATAWEGREDFDPREFTKASDGEKLSIIDQALDRDDWENRDDIEIVSEVLFMQEFHEFVFPLLRRSMASVPAHASKEMHGGFRLLLSPSRVPTDEITLRVNYSNFILLDSFETEDGRRMIDRDRPAESLLLQYGLPRNMAMYKHGPVGGQDIKPMFRDKDDPNYKQMLAWITMLRGPVHPIYNISYKPLIVEPVEEEPADEEPEEDAEPADDTLDVTPDEPTEEP